MGSSHFHLVGSRDGIFSVVLGPVGEGPWGGWEVGVELGSGDGSRGTDTDSWRRGPRNVPGKTDLSRRALDDSAEEEPACEGLRRVGACVPVADGGPEERGLGIEVPRP